MDTKKSLPQKDSAFFEEIAAVFMKYPGMNKQYSISCNSHLKVLEGQMTSSQTLKRRLDGNRIITEIIERSDLDVDGCCKYCVDDNGNTYCCISGSDC